jgi:hypothetical protein
VRLPFIPEELAGWHNDHFSTIGADLESLGLPRIRLEAPVRA